MRQIFFREVLTGADADVLNGSEMETSPGRGVYVIRAASTVSTATLAVASPGRPEVSKARTITLRANGEVLSQDTPWIVVVRKGDRVVVVLAGTTGTVHVEASYLGS